MSESNLYSDLSSLFNKIKDIEEDKNYSQKGDSKSNSKKYDKINKLIEQYIEKRKKHLNNQNNVTKDIIDGLKILKESYTNQQAYIEFNEEFSQKKKKIATLINNSKNNKSEIKQSNINSMNDDDHDDFGNINYHGIIEKCESVRNILNECNYKEDNNIIKKLNENISKINDEAIKLKNNSKLIDNEAIKRLNEEINAIKKESEKIYKKINTIENYMKKKKIYECK
jgi:ferredoxin-thioredoxin reductase catalytic subunit